MRLRPKPPCTSSASTPWGYGGQPERRREIDSVKVHRVVVVSAGGFDSRQSPKATPTSCRIVVRI